MEPDRLDELLRADRDRWAQIQTAKTPEELAAALRPPQRTARRGVARRLLGTLVSVAVAAAWVATWVQALPGLLPREANDSIAAPAERSRPSLAWPRDPVVNVVPLDGREAGISAQVNPRTWPAHDPQWRPDGRALLVMTPNGAVEIPRSRDSRPDWNRMRVLTGEFSGSTTYSPDGRRLAELDGRDYVRIVAPDSGSVRLLALPGNRVPRGVDWSADDRLVVLARRKVFVLRPDGTVLREIERPEDVRFPEWSPDATRLLVTQVRAEPALRLISLDSGASHRLLRTHAPSAWGSWSPDGRSVAFAKFVDGTWDLFVVDVASGRERRLTSGRGSETSPAWSPDGRWLAYVAQQP
jgi:dipeptidyl aminopeptidase/acylaminoacyl peptidase